MTTRSTRDADALSAAIDRNVTTLMRHDAETARRATLQQKLADHITDFAGSMVFVYLHIVLFGSWIVANLGWIPGIQPWDSSMVVLAMMASVEAIFISTFVLISQNRTAVLSERRTQLTLQIALLSEHETTRLLSLVSAVAEKLGVETPEEVRQLQRDTEPEAVLTRLEEGEDTEPDEPSTP